jgi:hypothetical protein
MDEKLLRVELLNLLCPISLPLFPTRPKALRKSAHKKSFRFAMTYLSSWQRGRSYVIQDSRDFIRNFALSGCRRKVKEIRGKCQWRKEEEILVYSAQNGFLHMKLTCEAMEE